MPEFILEQNSNIELRAIDLSERDLDLAEECAIDAASPIVEVRGQEKGGAPSA